MEKRYSYAALVNMLTTHKMNGEHVDFCGHEEVLAYIAEENASNRDVRVTDLVYLRVFGTGQTVGNKCKDLISKNLICSTTLEYDKRVRILKLTDEGRKYLTDRSKLLLKAIQDTSPDNE